MKFKNSKTYKNMKEAFAGESQARTKYSYYASKAKKEGYQQIAAIFEETAANEQEHAKLWFKAMHDNDVPTTIENLLDAAVGENSEWTEMYKRMAKEAREEGYEKFAQQFEGVANIEKTHEERFINLLENIKNGAVFQKEKSIEWKCRNCGHIHVGNYAPELCPVCDHPQAFFEVREKNY